MGRQQHRDHVLRDVPRVKQQGLSSDDERDSDVHRVAHEAMQALHHENPGRGDGRGRSTAN